MISSLIVIPAAAAVICFLLKNDRARRFTVIAAAAVHFINTLALWAARPVPRPQDWLGADALSLVFLLIMSTLFMCAAIYAVQYLATETKRQEEDFSAGLLDMKNAPEAVFCGCLLMFLSMMSAVILSRNFGLMWVAVEATTLSTAPLIYFHRSRHSLEATWKYLLICSVGIALALIGNFALAAAGGEHFSLQFSMLAENAKSLNPVWMKTAFIFMLVGYGTKAGLAPMHTWLPDAHSQSPSVVSSLLSGALLNCAMLAIIRMHGLCAKAGLAQTSSGMLIALGLASLLVAAVFIIRQKDYKRMLAYSSIENMGIIAVGLGGGATYAALLHAAGHSFIKGALFMTAGNILRIFKTKSCEWAKGLAAISPATAVLWFGGFLAISAIPPFSTFVSKFLILATLATGGHWVTAGLYLLFIAAVFLGMSHTVIAMTFSAPAPEVKPTGSPKGFIIPAAILLAAALALGLYMPDGIQALLEEAARL